MPCSVECIRNHQLKIIIPCLIIALILFVNIRDYKINANLYIIEYFIDIIRYKPVGIWLAISPDLTGLGIVLLIIAICGLVIANALYFIHTDIW